MILGFDISTAIIGIAKLNNNGTFIDAIYCDLRKIDKDLFLKGDFFKKFLCCNIELTENIEYIFIEDKLSGFAHGKTMQQTIMKLASFNAICSWIIRELYSIDLIHIHPSTVKKIIGLKIKKGEDKKKISLQYVSKLEDSFIIELNRNNNPKPYCYDKVDAYLVAKAGYKRFVC